MRIFQHSTTLHSLREEAIPRRGHQTQQNQPQQENLFCEAATTLCQTGRGLVAVCLALDTDEFFTEVRGRTVTGIAVAEDFSSAVEIYR